jgi:ribosome modulation factor
VGLMVINKDIQKGHDKFYQNIRNSGINAYEAGLSPESNPETHSSHRRIWLDGYVKAKRKGK